MKLFLLSFALLFAVLCTAQVPSYYNNVDLNATGSTLKSRLASKISSTHTTNLSYTPGVWNALRVADLNTGSSSKVLLIYGYSDSDGDYRTDRTRSKYDNGNNTGDWNREHVYPKSLGTPNLGTTGPGADVHHIRASDINRNASRGSRKFASGSGNSYATSQGNWYPGNEFKGDVARMVMYMYLRYGSRCLPKNVGVGSTVSNDQNMLQLFLQWNAEDPVSAFELSRNDVIQGYQGNRNPFIDNPAFATQIWGGPAAEDRFGNNNGGGGTPPSGSTTSVTVRITFDNYASETSWEILNGSNQVVHAGGNYGSQSSGSTLNITKSLADGCYTFVFKDSYGDGICCTNGNGSYALINNSTNNNITSGSTFTYQRTKSFCIGNARYSAPATELEDSEEQAQGAIILTLYPNPVQGQLYLKMDNPRPLDYTITSPIGQVVASGRVLHQQIEVFQLPRGVYQLSLQDGEEQVTKTFVKQ